MAIFGLLDGREPDNDMAQAAAKPLDADKIRGWIGDLKRTVYDRPAFDDAFARLGTDKSISAAEIVEIARGFAHGVKTKSKKDALLAIAQERMRLANGKAKAASAAKSKGW